MARVRVRNEQIEVFYIPVLVIIISLLYMPAVYSQVDHMELHRFEKYPETVSGMSFASPREGIRNGGEKEMTITKEGTWWERNWNWLIYLTILLGALYIIRRYELFRVRMRNQMKIANIETEKLKDIDQLKSRFYANISHEFRTPLTLIKGPLEQLIDENTDPQKRKTFKVMHANTSRLLELINQLLDLSRIESGNYVLKAQRGDIVGFVDGLTMSFTSMADQKNIALDLNVGPELLKSEIRNSFYFDPDILNKIINNLISNAFKFTPRKGSITIKMDLIREVDKREFLEIGIEDTGIGIDPDKLPYIFDRFYQVDRSRNPDYEGTGVGLAIVNELTRVHKGEIFVESKPGSGTVFRIRIPAGKSHLSSDQIVSEIPLYANDPLPSKRSISEEILDHSKGKLAENDENPWVLVVEDHEQVRQYIIESIQNEYRILQASNVPDGFELAEEFIPDLIVSDIMMPGIDGFKFCEKVKISEKTSHIPIVLLTARADVNDKIIGLKRGADDYLTKPFNAEELRIRIGNLIDNRRALRQKFSSNSIIKPGEISVSSHDATFMERLLGLVESNMSNVHFSVEEFGREAGLSQSQLHRKLKAIVNMSAIQFIRSVRMHRSMELLQNGVGNIAEVAYMVGYDDPGYFSKSFRKFFDKLPSEVSRK